MICAGNEVIGGQGRFPTKALLRRRRLVGVQTQSNERPITMWINNVVVVSVNRLRGQDVWKDICRVRNVHVGWGGYNSDQLCDGSSVEHDSGMTVKAK